ncbi:MAG TPA: hypothetical protein VFW98_14855, partial [Gemmatimonadaceae bacterium]|nr:hypothetical protein [Gemmatimonadaceae bacterium]
MSNTQIRLRHFAFFEALAGAPDESSEEWRTAKAGLLTLRMYDNWADFGARVITTNEWGVRAVRRTITMIRKGNPLRTLILAVLDGMRKAPDAEAISLAAPLMAYARALEYEARWALAADVYSTVGERASYSGQTRLSISLYMSRGACLRTLARWSEATMMYKQAAWLAEHLGDTENVL